MSLDQSLVDLSRSIAVLDNRLNARLAALLNQVAALRAENDSLRSGPIAFVSPPPAAELPLGLGSAPVQDSRALQDELDAAANAYAELKAAYGDLERRHVALQNATADVIAGLDQTIGALEHR